MSTFNRRNFLRTSMVGGVAASFFNHESVIPTYSIPENSSSRVSITTDDNRADMAFHTLKPFSKQIKQAIGNRRVIIKPNNVLIYVPLACTHVDTLDGVLKFLQSINKLDNVIIAESTASGSTLEGSKNYGYFDLLSKYPEKLVDLDAEPYAVMYVVIEKEMKPFPVRVASIMHNSNSYIISVARMKTHTSFVDSFSQKNIVFGAPMKDIGFTFFSEDKWFSANAVETKPNTVSYKRIIYGDGFRGVKYNIFSLAWQLHPHLALIDGYEGMEGNGPTLGTPIDHRICVASQDWLAAHRVGIELMGIDFSKVGYLNFCTQAGMGVVDLNKIEIVGENIADHIKKYKLPDNYEKMMVWIKSISQT